MSINLCMRSCNIPATAVACMYMPVSVYIHICVSMHTSAEIHTHLKAHIHTHRLTYIHAEKKYISAGIYTHT